MQRAREVLYKKRAVVQTNTGQWPVIQKSAARRELKRKALWRVFGMKYRWKGRQTETRHKKWVKGVEQLSLNTPASLGADDKAQETEQKAYVGVAVKLCPHVIWTCHSLQKSHDLDMDGKKHCTVFKKQHWYNVAETRMWMRSCRFIKKTSRQPHSVCSSSFHLSHSICAVISCLLIMNF